MMNDKTKLFIKKAVKKHGGRYDYSKVEYINCRIKVIIICNEHGEFMQRPSSHLNGYGCEKCGKSIHKQKLTYTTDIFIEKAKIIHKDTYDYSKVKYINNKTKVSIICKIHGNFMQTPQSHLNGSGCKKCSDTNFTHTIATFIEKAKIIHGNKYDYSKVKYINNKTKVNIICKIHGIFMQTPHSHLNENGCRKCGTISYLKKRFFSYTTDNFIEKSKIIHGDKYDYSDVKYINSMTKVNIICKNHGNFMQAPAQHLRGAGCGKCSGRYMDQEYFIKKAKIIHKDKYDYSNVIYVKNKIKVIIICSIHGEFKQTPHDHLSGHGCSKCAGKYLDKEYFIERSRTIHKNKYDYSNVIYKRGDIKVEIICKKHGKFEQIPHHHLAGLGCYKCNMCPSCQLWRTRGALCIYCKPKSKNQLYKKTKEWLVVNFLRQNILDHDFIHNRSVGKDCTGGHLFPDIRFDCGHYNLIIEVDEHKHRGSNYKCDEQRMRDIIAKLGQPCIFIRYNPDDKKSDINILLQTVRKYLDLSIEYKEWDIYGLLVEYLFY